MYEVGGVKRTRKQLVTNGRCVVGGIKEAMRENTKKAVWAQLARTQASILQTRGNWQWVCGS